MTQSNGEMSQMPNDNLFFVVVVMTDTYIGFRLDITLKYSTCANPAPRRTVLAYRQCQLSTNVVFSSSSSVSHCGSHVFF